MRLSYEQEKTIVGAFLKKLGLPDDQAEILNEVMCYSDFTGVYSHGLSRFLMYVNQFKHGALNVNPDVRIIHEQGSIVKYDCDHASGIIAVNLVYDHVKELAKQYGIAIGTGMHASNIGCGSYYGRRAAGDNLMCIFVSNTSLAMAPFGGAERLIGTNPIIMACPTDRDFPLILDISTSNVAMGKVMAFKRDGKPIPLGWANDKNGVPTTDPAQAYTLSPIGAHKGYGLAVFVDLLGAVLAGANFGSEIPSVHDLKPDNTGFSLILIDVEKFHPLADFKARVGEYIDMMKNSRKADGVDEIYMPGEIESVKLKEYMENGIEISDQLCAALEELALSLGLIAEGEGLMAMCGK